MNRRQFLTNSSLASVGLGLTACQTGTSSSPSANSANLSSKKMNHLFFIVDDLNLSLGCYGHSAAFTPNIDRLAARGTRFANAFCPYPLCGPSRTAMLTGQRPEAIPMPNNEVAWRDLVPDIRTLPEVFRRAGYRTAGYGKIFHHGIQAENLDAWRKANPDARLPHDQKDPASWTETAIDEADVFYEIHAKGPERVLDGVAHGGTSLHSIRAVNPDILPDYLSANHAIDFLKNYSNPESRTSNPESQNFFLGVGFHKPHVPFIAPEKWFAFYDSLDVEQLRPPTWFQPASLPEGTLKQSRTHRGMDEEERQHCYKGYLACVSWMDEQLGRVMAALEAQGLSGNTTISFVADHGYHLGEHTQWDKMMLLDPALRVPLILAGPGIPAGQVTEATTESLDLFPTICQLHGIDPKQSSGGKSLQPWLKDPDTASARPAFAWVNAGKRQGWSIRTDRYRYGLTSYDEAEAKPYLFDYLEDPEETTDIADRPESAAIQADLDRQLRAHFDTLLN